VCNTEFSGAGKGEYKVCASNERNMDAQGRGNMGVLDKTKNIKCTLGGKKGKEKTDEDSSVLLYFMTEEGERE